MSDHDNNIPRSDKFMTFGLPLLISSMVLVALLGVFFRYFNADEAEAIHTAWKIGQGQVIYVDFFQHHHPLLYYILLPVLSLFGETLNTVLAARMLIFVFFAAILYISYRIAMLAFARNTALTGLLLLTTTVIFMDAAIEIRPDVPQTLFGLLSVYFLLKYLEKPDRNLIYSAVSLGISFLFLQKAVVLGILFMPIFLYYGRKNRRYLLHGSVFYLVTAFTVLPYFIFLLWSGSFKSYFIFNWIVNIAYLNSTSLARFFMPLLAVNLVLCVSFLGGLVILPKHPSGRILAWLALGHILFLTIMNVPREHYLLPIIPLTVPIAAYALGRIHAYNRLIFMVILTITTIVAGAILVSRITCFSNKKQFARWSFIHAVTGPEDRVYIGGSGYNLYRQDLDFFWFATGKDRALQTYQQFWPYYYDVYELIDEYEPTLITDTYLDMQDNRIADHYENSGIYDDLFVRTK